MNAYLSDTQLAVILERFSGISAAERKAVVQALDPTAGGSIKLYHGKLDTWDVRSAMEEFAIPLLCEFRCDTDMVVLCTTILGNLHLAKVEAQARRKEERDVQKDQEEAAKDAQEADQTASRAE